MVLLSGWRSERDHDLAGLAVVRGPVAVGHAVEVRAWSMSLLRCRVTPNASARGSAGPARTRSFGLVRWAAYSAPPDCGARGARRSPRDTARVPAGDDGHA